MSAFLTTHEAAAELRCHEKTIRRMIGRGDLRAQMVAGKYLIDPKDLPLELPPRPAPPRHTARKRGHFSELAASLDDAA